MESKQKYTVSYFIEKFSAIPEELWIVNDQGEIEREGNRPHCAIGWCRDNVGNYGWASTSLSMEASALEGLLHSAGIESISTPGNREGWNIADLNNGIIARYPQPTPKQRVLAALYDIQKMQEPKKEEPLPAKPMSFVAYQEMKEETELLFQN